MKRFRWKQVAFISFIGGVWGGISESQSLVLGQHVPSTTSVLCVLLRAQATRKRLKMSQHVYVHRWFFFGGHVRYTVFLREEGLTTCVTNPDICLSDVQTSQPTAVVSLF